MNLERYKKIFAEFATDADFIDKNIKKLNLKKDSILLDIGTGLGAMATLLALNGFNLLTGEPEYESNHHTHPMELEKHEHYEEHLESSCTDWKKAAKSLGVEERIKYQNFDAQNLFFDDESFDGVFIYDALQHIKNREQAIEESIRVAKPNGIVVVIEWNEKQIEEDFKKYGFRSEYIDPRDLLKSESIKIVVNPGEYVNFFIIRKV